MERNSTLRERMSLWTAPQISVNTLKLIGAVLMVLYFFSASVVQNGVLHVSSYTAEELSIQMANDSQVMLWAGISSVASVIGMLGVPVFAWLLVQGAEHTSNMGRYLLAVLVFALISEIPYDLAMFGQVWNWSEQNSLWTVLIALIMLWLMKSFQGKGMVPLLLSLFFAGAGCFWAIVLHCKFGGGFVLLTAVLYLFRERKGIGFGLGALVSLIYATAPLGLIPVALCDGQRREMGQGKYKFYLFYPVMLALFALWSWLV